MDDNVKNIVWKTILSRTFFRYTLLVTLVKYEMFETTASEHYFDNSWNTCERPIHHVCNFRIIRVMQISRRVCTILREQFFGTIYSDFLKPQKTFRKRLV